MKTYLIIVFVSVIGGMIWSFGAGGAGFLVGVGVYGGLVAWWLYGAHLIKTGQVKFDDIR